MTDKLGISYYLHDNKGIKKHSRYGVVFLQMGATKEDSVFG